MYDQAPPHSKEAEQIVLAAAFRNSEARQEILSELQVEDYYFEHHQKLFSTMRALNDEGKPSDAASVMQYLSERSQLGDAGVSNINQIWADYSGSHQSMANWRHFASICRDTAKTRQLITACAESLRDAYLPSSSVEGLVGSLEQKLFAIAAGRGSTEPTELLEVIKERLQGLDARMMGEGEIPLSTGLPALDAILGGFRNGQLTIVAARPSDGKTALALTFALHVIQQAPTLFFSMEMSKESLAERAMAYRASVPLHVITGGSCAMDENDYFKVVATAFDTPHGLWIDDRSNLSPAEVMRRTRQQIRKRGIKLIVVDYLQRMAHDTKVGTTTTRQVGETAKSLKTLARNCGIPVIALAQLNRQVSNRQGEHKSGEEDKMPRLSDLRDSGEIEQEADNVLLLHPQNPSTSDPTRQEVECIVAKQRNGPKNIAKLMYRRPYTRFE